MILKIQEAIAAIGRRQTGPMRCMHSTPPSNRGAFRAGCDRIESVCVAVLARRSGRRGAKVDAGTSDERRNEPGVRENATRMGRALFARGFVAGLDRITRYALRPAPARDAKIAPAQTI